MTAQVWNWKSNDSVKSTYSTPWPSTLHFEVTGLSFSLLINYRPTDKSGNDADGIY
jgi:hypothetical protein